MNTILDWMNPTRWIILGLLVLALIAAGWRVHHNIWTAGYDTRDAEAKQATLEAMRRNDRIQTQLQADADQSTKAKDEKIRSINARLVSALGELRNRPDRRPGNLPTPAGTCEGGTGAGLSGPDSGFLVWQAARAATILAERDDCYRKYDAVRSAQPQAATTP